MKDRKSLVVWMSLLLICTTAGCGRTEEVPKAEAAETTKTDGHASVNKVTLTSGRYSEEKLDDTWEEEDTVFFHLEKDKITMEEKGLAAEASVSKESSSDTDSGMEHIRINGNAVTITGEGTYYFSGTLEDGQIIVDAKKDDVVRLVLGGVNVTCGSSSPLYSKGGDVIITLADGTENILADAQEYQYEKEGGDEPDATVFAKDDLTFNGTGTLKVTGNYDHAVHCKDDLKFVTGTYILSAADDGIVGKDSVSVKNGNFTIESGDDGIKASNWEEPDKGYVLIEDGSFEITAGGDGIQAETLLRINDGNIEIVTGGGSENAEERAGGAGNEGRRMPPASGGPEEAPGIVPEGEAGSDGSEAMPEKPGTIPDEGAGSDGAGRMPSESQEPGTIPDEGTEGDSLGRKPPEIQPPESVPEGEAGSDDSGWKPSENQDPGAVPEGVAESDDSRRMPPENQDPGAVPDEGLEGEASSEEDTKSTKAMKSYVDLVIAGGEYSLDSCDDAIHSDQNVTIKDGVFSILTGDDGIHADQKLTVDGGAIDVLQSYEGMEGFEIEVNGGDIQVKASDDGINAALHNDGKAEEDQGAVMTFNAGNIYVDADGDGLDANGEIFINGGTLTVEGPVSGGNGTLDYASVCKITGGTFIGTGSAGMVQNPSEDSTQQVLVWNMVEPAEAGTVISVYGGEGEAVAEITLKKPAQWFAVSSPELAAGGVYTIRAGDTEQQARLDTIVTQIPSGNE